MKKRQLQKLSLLLSTAMLVTSVNIPAFAEPIALEEDIAETTDEEAEETTEVEADDGALLQDILTYLEENDVQNYGRIANPMDIETQSITEFAEDEPVPEDSERLGADLPGKYITPISEMTNLKDQGAWGTCWSQAAMAAVESSGIKSGVFADRSINLSELAFCRYNFNGKKFDKFGNFDGDTANSSLTFTNPLDENNVEIEDYLNNGGFQSFSAVNLMNWIGPQLDKGDFAYSNTHYQVPREYENGYYTPFFELAKSDDVADKNKVMKLIRSQKPMDSIEDYVKSVHYKGLENLLDESHDSLAYENDAAHIMGYKYVPLDDPNQRDGVKQLITDYGIVDCGVYSGYASDGRNFYVSENNCYYNYEFGIDDANHEVTLVGWDDSIPKENFDNGSGNIPAEDGGWLLRNTWTYEPADGTPGVTDDDPSDPNAGNLNESGYFWISYCDPSIDFAYAYDVESADNYENIYQYDGSILTDDVYCNSGSSYANVFEVKGDDQVLKAVSFATSSTNSKVTVDIYTDVTDSPTSGTCVSEATTSIKTTYAGAYTIPLNSFVELKKGTKYSVKITLEKKGTDISILAEASYLADSPSKFYAGIDPGESFIFTDDKWEDMYDVFGPESNLKDEGYYLGNLRIKAYTDSLSGSDTFIKYNVKYGLNNPDNPRAVPSENKILKDPTIASSYVEFEGWVDKNDDPITVIPADGSVTEVFAHYSFDSEGIKTDGLASVDDTVKIESEVSGRKTIYKVTPDLSKDVEHITVIKGNKILINANADIKGLSITKGKKQKGYTFYSDSNRIASVSKKGIITAKKEGTARIEYSVKNNVKTIVVDVVSPKVTYSSENNQNKLRATVTAGSNFRVLTNIPLNYDKDKFVVSAGKETNPIVKDVECNIDEEGNLAITGTALRKGTAKVIIPVNGKKVTVKIQVKKAPTT